MHPYEQITHRFGFEVPDDYRTMRARGFFDHEGPNEVFLTDLNWLRLTAIAETKPSAEAKAILPFARTARRELFGWHVANGVDRPAPIAFCPRGEDPIVYAADFSSFIFRTLLEEFSLSWLVNNFGLAHTARRLRKYAQDVGPFLPEEWARTLVELSRRPLRRLADGVHGFLDREECDQIIKETLSFPGINESLDEITVEASVGA